VDKILEKAKTLEADLLCLGTTGKGGVDRLFLGSVAGRLVRMSQCPVLTIR
jgi:nucleotide-binding universal stress UspA family protein